MMWGDYCPWCGGNLGGAGGGDWLVLVLLGLFGLLVLIGLGLMLYWAMSRGAGGGSGGPPDRKQANEDRALEEARARYARGEISREEFDEIRRTLTG
jgi:putative membrane protein